MSHTEGKLKFDGHYILTENGGAVGIFGGIDPENPRRMVACWNALDGVPTEWLENYVSGDAKNILQENTALQAEVERLQGLLSKRNDPAMKESK